MHVLYISSPGYTDRMAHSNVACFSTICVSVLVHVCMPVYTVVHCIILSIFNYPFRRLNIDMGVENRGGPRVRHFASENFLTFRGKFSDFHPPKFLMTFFVIESKFLIFSPFSQFHCYLRKLFPIYLNFFQKPPLFTTFFIFYTIRAPPGPLSQNRAPGQHTLCPPLIDPEYRCRPNTLSYNSIGALFTV